MSDLLTVTQTAELLGVSGQAIRKAIAEGRLQGEKLGNNWVIKRDVVEAYRERKEKGTRA